MKDKRGRYGIAKVFGERGDFWQIVDSRSGDGPLGKVVWEAPYLEEHDGLEEPPENVRREYERIIDYDPRSITDGPFNIVELVASGDGSLSGFNQKCAHGSLVEGHAVYCHNQEWLYAPRKCRRTWYTGGEVRDEDCPGYKPNTRSAAT